MKPILYLSLIAFCLVTQVKSQNPDTSISNFKNEVESMSYELAAIKKAVDDIYWYNRVGDVAFIDKVYITGPPILKKTAGEEPNCNGYQQSGEVLFIHFYTEGP